MNMKELEKLSEWFLRISRNNNHNVYMLGRNKKVSKSTV